MRATIDLNKQLFLEKAALTAHLRSSFQKPKQASMVATLEPPSPTRDRAMQEMFMKRSENRTVHRSLRARRIEREKRIDEYC